MDIRNTEQRIKVLKSIKPYAVVNGIRYFTPEEHQKFLDNIELTDKVYTPQRDETGKVVFNGIDRVVVNPETYFAVAYKLTEDKAYFVIDGLALYARRRGGRFEMPQVEAYVATVKDEVIQNDYRRTYVTREDFLNNFNSNLYVDAPEQAIAVYTKLSTVEHAAAEKQLKFSK